MTNFPAIGLLITHYNRSKSLQNLLEAFRRMECSFGQIVVSDDGSNSEHMKHLRQMQKEYSFKLLTSVANRGLGSNLNKGQDAISTEYTLYIQEDFEPQSAFPTRLKDALNYLENDISLDMIRFYAYFPYPYLKKIDAHFSEMYIEPFAKNYNKIYYYSDHPHLRRSTFFKKFGRYAEGLKGDRTEYRMCISVIQNNGKGLFYHDCQELFKQLNSENEPSTMSRKKWVTTNNMFIRFIRNVYRQIRYNFDILFMQPLKNV